MNDKLISRTKMSGDDIYCFCPYCVKEAKETGQDYKTLPPLFKLVIATPIPGREKGSLETRYECPKCRKGSTLETFLDFYTEHY